MADRPLRIVFKGYSYQEIWEIVNEYSQKDQQSLKYAELIRNNDDSDIAGKDNNRKYHISRPFLIDNESTRTNL